MIMQISLTIIMPKIKTMYRMGYVRIFVYSYYLNISVFNIPPFLDLSLYRLDI